MDGRLVGSPVCGRVGIALGALENGVVALNDEWVGEWDLLKGGGSLANESKGPYILIAPRTCSRVGHTLEGGLVGMPLGAVVGAVVGVVSSATTMPGAVPVPK